jgi:hypothetical protein
VLTGEEMRRNLAYGDHARRHWLSLVDQHDMDPLVRDGKIAFALERVTQEEERTSALINKWTPVLERAASSVLLRGHMDEILHAAGLSSKGKGRVSESTKPTNAKALVLHVEELQGLAMATNDHNYEPRYIYYSHRLVHQQYLTIVLVGQFKSSPITCWRASNRSISTTCVNPTPNVYQVVSNILCFATLSVSFSWCPAQWSSLTSRAFITVLEVSLKP